MKSTERNKNQVEFIEKMNVKKIPDDEITIGIDEVAVSPIAGPMISALVVMPKKHGIERLPVDSKKLNEQQIKELAEKIEKVALYISYASLYTDQLTNKGTHKIRLKLNRKNALEFRKHSNKKIVLDGAEELGDVKGVVSVVRAESKNSAVSAASILAKHRSNQIMDEYHQEYPYYGFDKHRGYGTKEHFEAIRKYGYCPYHRNKSKKFTKDPLVDLRGTAIEEYQWQYIISELNKAYRIKEELMGEYAIRFFEGVSKKTYRQFSDKMKSVLVKIYFETVRTAQKKGYQVFNIENNMWTFDEQKLITTEINTKVKRIIDRYQTLQNRLTAEDRKIIKKMVKQKTEKQIIEKEQINKFRYLCDNLKI